MSPGSSSIDRLSFGSLANRSNISSASTCRGVRRGASSNRPLFAMGINILPLVKNGEIAFIEAKNRDKQVWQHALRNFAPAVWLQLVATKDQASSGRCCAHLVEDGWRRLLGKRCTTGFCFIYAQQANHVRGICMKGLAFICLVYTHVRIIAFHAQIPDVTQHMPFRILRSRKPQVTTESRKK